MNIPASHSRVLQSKVFSEILTHASKFDDVRAEVYANHDNNRWWPTDVADWRLRILLAGWSTRVSYYMIGSYAGVVRECNELGFDSIRNLSKDSLANLVKPLGLFNARWTYYESACAFIDQIGSKSALNLTSNDDLIERFQSSVDGAGYKVAQCAVLYAKGYHCGIMPVDSGMVEMLAPCFGEPLPSGAVAHELIRNALEEFVQANPPLCRKLIFENGYDRLTIPDQSPPTWWAHLVLIYYKRLYWNKNKSSILIRKPNRTDLPVDEPAPAIASAQSRSVVLYGDDSIGIDRVIQLLTRSGYTNRVDLPEPWVVKRENVGPDESTLPSDRNSPILILIAASQSSLRKQMSRIEEKSGSPRHLVYGFVGPYVSSSLIAKLAL